MGTQFLWDPVEDNIVKELDDAGSTIADYTTEPYLYGDLISQHRDGQSRFHCFDGQGSTTALTDASANVTDTYAYTAFGVLTEQTDSTANPFQYVGRSGYYRDDETDEYDVRQRPLLPSTARWMSADPSGLSAHDMNLYRYGANSPMHYIDLHFLTKTAIR